MSDEEIEVTIQQLPMTRHGISRKALEELVRKTEYVSGLDMREELRRLYNKYREGIPKEELQ